MRCPIRRGSDARRSVDSYNERSLHNSSPSEPEEQGCGESVLGAVALGLGSEVFAAYAADHGRSLTHS